ncbi:MAG: glycosyltransferase family 2 protein [Rhodospirillales bacterium]|nr:glycosyltransferase family 2 protein [Rhodospirillales bacterium]
MKASVIMPVYNGSQYLAAAFESVLAQTYPLHEIIVIDDGSTDSSPDILRSYGDRLRVTRQDNQGIAAARNVGLRQVTGDVINFIDQDDLWPAGRTEALVRALQSDPDALVAAGQVEILWERSQPQNPLDNFETAVREFYVGSLCIRKEVFELLGPFHTGIGYADDTDFLMRRREANIKTAYVDDVTLRYRLHESNTSFHRSVTNAHLMAALRESLRRRRKKEGQQRDARS